MWDDELPRPKKEITIGMSLDTLSVDELNELIEAHEEEIERIKAERQKKQAKKDAAASFFKSGG